MNLLILVEGRSTEKKLYRKWIPYISPLMKYVYSSKLLSTDYVEMSFIIGNTIFKCDKQVIDRLKDLLPPDLKPYKNILTGFLDINTYVVDNISPYKHKSTGLKRRY